MILQKLHPSACLCHATPNLVIDNRHYKTWATKNARMIIKTSLRVKTTGV